MKYYQNQYSIALIIKKKQYKWLKMNCRAKNVFFSIYNCELMGKIQNGTGHESGTLVKRIEELIVLESAIHSWPEYIT